MPPNVTWPELMAAISLAADTGMAQPLETGLATCLVSVALAERLGLDDDSKGRIHQLALLQHIGCTAAAAAAAAAVGDEMIMRAHASTLDFSDQRQMLRFMLSHVARTNSVLARPAALARLMIRGGEVTDTARDVCEAARMLGPRCGYDPAHLDDFDAVYENWDGTGFPGDVSGDAIPLPVRVVQVATLAVCAHRQGGVELSVRMISARRGHTLAPDVADALLGDLVDILAQLDGVESLWEAAIAAAPTSAEPRPADVDDALRAVADFVDLKSPAFVGHSSGVADLAGDAARHSGLDADAVTLVRRAGCVHDIGRIGVSAAVWGRRGPLRPDEREQVRLHPYYTERVLDRTPFLRSLSVVASAHHERLDGSGYFRGSTGAVLSRPARILAAADTFHAMIETRPYRDALTREVAAKELRAEVAAGRLDGPAAESVLAAAGLPSRKRDTARAELTARETQILCQVARGLSMREIARALSISPKTVDGHLQRLYSKIGVSTRAGATLHALGQGLLAVDAKYGENSP